MILPGKMGDSGTGGGIRATGPETKRRLIIIDPARGHMDKLKVVIPIELTAPGD